MNVHWLRPFWFGGVYYTDSSEHHDYLTIRFKNRPNVDAQVWLDIVSPGATFQGGAVTMLGTAAAGFKSYAWVDDQGEIQSQTFDHWVSSVRVERIVDLTVVFNVRLAWASADGMIYYWTRSMNQRNFTPPAYRETIWRIINKSTGETLATETIWTDEGAETYEPGPSSALLRRYETPPDGQHRDVDVVRVEDRPEGTRMRVEPESGASPESPESAGSESLHPLRFEVP